MPVTATHLTDGVSSASPTAPATASVSPTQNRLQLLLVNVTRGDSTNPAQPSSVTGCGLTWVLVDSSQYDAAGLGRGSAFLYRALGTPTTGAVTITLGYTASFVAWTWDEFGSVNNSGTNGSGAIVQNAKATGTGNSPSVTLSAFGSTDNATYGGLAHRDANGATFTAGTGFTELGENGTTSTQRVFAASEWRNDNDTSVDGTVTSGADGWAMFAVEIKYAAPSAPRRDRTLPRGVTRGVTRGAD